MLPRFGPLMKNWATFYGNCFPKGLVRNFLVMMTSSMTSITVSNPHNPAKKTDLFRKKHLRIGSSCVSVAAYFQRQHLRISRDSICLFPETASVFRVVVPPVADFQ